MATAGALEQQELMSEGKNLSLQRCSSLKGLLKVVGKLLRVDAQIGQLRHFLPLVEKVIKQTKERMWGGNCHVEGKVLSLFEPHTEVIRKGKAHKPNEFGRLVRIDEVENGIVSGYQVLTGNPADPTYWMPALEQHQACFGRVPEMATGDRGFFSAKNERAAQKLGVKKVALPACGRLSIKRAKQQKQRWFRRALRWRAGCEATISTLKHPFSMLRATYKRDPGFQRYVGWCVITKNLFSIARYRERVWQRSLFSEPYRKLTAPVDKRAATVKEMDPSMVRI